MCHSHTTDELLNDCSARCLTLYGSFTSGDWLLCYQQLCNFFKGRKVRVSIFLQAQLQATDGTLSVNGHGPLPEGAQMPGTLRRFSLDGDLISTSTVRHPLDTECVLEDDHGAALARALGSSMYRTSTTTLHTPAPADAKPTAAPKLNRRSTAKDELELLSDLLGDDTDAAASQEMLTLDFLDCSSRDLASTTSERGMAPMPTLDGTAEWKSARDMMQDLNLESKDEAESDSKRDGTDLLDLLDESK